MLPAVLTGVVLLAAAALTGCTQHPAQQSSDLWLGPEAIVGVSELGDDWTRLSAPDGLLVMPTVAVQVDRLKRADTLSSEDCAILDCSAADPGMDEQDPEHGLQAWDGDDLVAVILRAPAADPPFRDAEGLAGLTVTVGQDERQIEPEELQAAQVGTFVRFITTIPDDAETLDLAITHDGVTGRLDLLSGDLVEEAATGWLAALRDGSRATIERTDPRSRGTMRTTDSRKRFPFWVGWRFPSILVRSPWTPSLGWAGEARTWLLLDPVTVSTPPETGTRVSLDEAEVDEKRSLIVTARNGRPTAPVEGLSSSYGGAAGPIAWRVPDDTRSGTLRVGAVVEVQVYDWHGSTSGQQGAVWARAPKPLDIDFEFPAPPAS